LRFGVVSLFLVFLLAFCSFSVKASSVQTVTVSADTFVDSYGADHAFGQEPYVRVADSYASIALAFLMFNLSGVSYVFNASSDVELRLFCCNVSSPHIIVGAHWCVNNTWSEDTLAFDSISDFSRSNSPESVVAVSSNYTWYSWTVTDFVRWAMQQPALLDTITLVMEPENTVSGNYTMSFYSKDQSLTQYYPQLVFSYKDMMNPMYTYLEAGFAFVAVAGIAVVVYRSSARRKRKKSARKSLSR
jgi:hypothetical protein